MPEATLYQLVDFEKAFDSVHHEGRWRILRANGMPQQIIDLKRLLRLLHMQSSSETSFEVRSAVRPGCTMSAMLFHMTITLVMGRTTEDRSRGIRWTLFPTMEDLDFADDLALVSHTQEDVQEKTTRRIPSWPEGQLKGYRSDAVERFQP